jgi:Heterokaryon incompatibility protein (HET)
MDRYQYQKLNQGDIRLLRFRSFHEGDLSFELQHKTLDKTTPPYAALSYTWGEAHFPHRLHIGNSFLPITENLRDALVHIRRRLATKSKLLTEIDLIWVDAICIDQSNDDEKGNQIGLMASLYSQASQIYVWLGLPENDTNVHLAMEKMNYFFSRYISAIKNVLPYRPWWWPSKIVRMDENVFNILSRFSGNDTKVFDVEGSKTHAAWLGIVEIWQKPWWNRAWILQESTIVEDTITKVVLGLWAINPKHKVHFFCGRYSTHWAPIQLSILVADHLHSMPLLKTSFLKGQSGLARKVLLVKVYRLANNELGFLELLQLFRHSECSNPRDKVYSLLGLAPDSVRHQLIPNYKKSPIEVYLDVARHALNQPAPDLDFLGYAMKLDSPQRALSTEISHTTWPSWIPNWNDPLLLHPIPKALYSRDTSHDRSFLIFRKKDRARPAFALQKAYNASFTLPVDASISNYQLDIKGVLVDVIVDLFDYYTMTWDQRRGKCNAWSAKLNKKYPTNETFDVALARVQVADVQYNDFSYAISRNNSVSNPLLGKPRAELTPDEFKAQSQMRTALTRATAFRGVCLTKQGYLGLVPRSARKGDRICVLLGGQVLYVLRAKDGAEQGNKNEYIGECYVHGLMDGEVMSWVQEGKAVMERFVLV